MNAHGTGTPLNDVVETRALKQVFGPACRSRSDLQHQEHAGARDDRLRCDRAGRLCPALKNGVIPPTINLENPDPECDLDYVPHFAREVDCRHVVSTSIGFGGQNAAPSCRDLTSAPRDVEVVRRAA